MPCMLLVYIYLGCYAALSSVNMLASVQRGKTKSKDVVDVSRFLNRLLGIQTTLQNKLFAFFSDTMDAVIRKAKRLGRYDGGILGACV